jgi:hypothetical protein
VSTLIILIVTFGLLLVLFAALANGLNLNISATMASLKGRALPTVGVLIANFVCCSAPRRTDPLRVPFHCAGDDGIRPALRCRWSTVRCCDCQDRQWRYGLRRSHIPDLAPGDDSVHAAGAPWLLAALDVAQTSVSTWHLLEPLLWFILLPLGLGLAVKWRYLALAEKAAPHCGQVSLVAVAFARRSDVCRLLERCRCRAPHR